LLLTNDQEIKRLNKLYRKIDTPTDVLAFSLLEEQEKFFKANADKDEFKEYLLGDIVISTETAERQAKELKHSFQEEMTILLIHGLLHLLGFDHIDERDAEKMQLETARILQSIRKEQK
ncbi:MAG: rRNA maturation RNase YbeY, partial [Atribacterota bacterium]